MLKRTTNHYYVEAHIQTAVEPSIMYVFVHEFSSEEIAKRCFDRLETDGSVIIDIRCWFDKSLVAQKGYNGTAVWRSPSPR